MSKRVKVLCISGSLRGSKSYSDGLILQIAGHIEGFGGESEIIRLNECTIKKCEGCYSVDRKKCVWPCIHDKLDQTTTILEKIIRADALVIASGVYWGTVSSYIHELDEKMLTLDVNRDKIKKIFGQDPFDGKPMVLICSQEADGAGLALSQLNWAYSHMGITLLPFGDIFKPNLLERKIVRMALKVIREAEYKWIDESIRLAAWNLVKFPEQMKNYPMPPE